MKKIVKSIKPLSVAAIMTLATNPAFAAGSSLPWEQHFNDFIATATGPVALAAGVIAILTTSFGMAFGENGSVLKKGMFVTAALSTAFAATALVTRFGFAGGLSV
jgi:type IV secretion system protein VirB2